MFALIIIIDKSKVPHGAARKHDAQTKDFEDVHAASICQGASASPCLGVGGSVEWVGEGGGDVPSL